MFQDANPTDVEAAERSLRKALFVTDPSADRHSLIDKKGLRVAGTCEWIERNETYKAWLAGDPSLLWIFGGPGKGKTMLSIYLTQQFEQLHGTEVIYFFCSSEHLARSTATGILRTLLWQMVAIRPGLTKLISSYFDPPERTQAVLSTPGSLWEIFTKVVQSSELGNMHCIIDGLDECDDESSRWLASQFTELSSQSNNRGLHIVIASRHMSSAKHIKQIHLDPDNDQNVSDDIEKFASLKMKELSERLDLTTACCSRVQSQLLAKAGGTFLWIGYAMIELSSKRTSLEVEEAVKELPTALPALYGRMLRRIPPGKLNLIITLLHWVTLAVMPLSIGALKDLVTWQIPEHMDRRQALRDYISLCEPMVVVQHDQVLLVHQSARDYFLRDTRDDDVVAERVRATFSDAQASLAKTCLDALEKSSSLSAYATIHWPHHLIHCSKSVQNSLVNDRPFFGKGSASRHAWWQRWKHHYGSQSPLVAEPPRLHTACFFGLEVWAQRALCEVSSVEADRTLRSRVRTVRTSESSSQRRRNCVNFRSEIGWVPLHFAVRAKYSYDVVSFLLRNGADPELLDLNMRTTLAVAADEYTQLGTVKLLLASGADPDGGFRDGDTVSCTPLRRAVELCREDIAVSILDSGADIQAADEVRHSEHSSPTVLQLAASIGLVALDGRLLEHGADPQAAQGESPIPLCLAILKKNMEVVDLMLDRSVSGITLHTSCASWPLYTALTCRNIGLAQKIVCLGVTRGEFPTVTLELWAAILDSDVAEVTSALEQGARPNTPTTSSPGSPGGLTSLHWAVVEWQRQGYYAFTMVRYGSIVRRLLEHGADASLRDADGKTALQRAEPKGRVWAAMASLIAKSKTRAVPTLADCNLDLLRTGGRR
jgi:ankyrin repeat protein